MQSLPGVSICPDTRRHRTRTDPSRSSPLSRGGPATRAPAGANADSPEVAHQDDDHEGLGRVLKALRQACGTDFNPYKKTTLRRRIARRMAVSQIAKFGDYAQHLEGNVTEAKALYEECLISVTSFFRDPEVFEALNEQVLRRLLKDLPADAPLRLWVPGCATGEEVYSIAMSLLELTADQSCKPSLQIFATDLSERALAKAREGTYLMNIARDVSAERLRRFFVKVGDNSPNQQSHSRDVRLRLSRSDPRSAFLAHRSHQLSQCPHLPRASAPRDGVGDLPLCTPAGWLFARRVG